MFFCCPFSCTGKHDDSIPHNNMGHEPCQPWQCEFSKFNENYSTKSEDFFNAENLQCTVHVAQLSLVNSYLFFSIGLFAIQPRIKLHPGCSVPSF